MFYVVNVSNVLSLLFLLLFLFITYAFNEFLDKITQFINNCCLSYSILCLICKIRSVIFGPVAKISQIYRGDILVWATLLYDVTTALLDQESCINGVHLIKPQSPLIQAQLSANYTAWVSARFSAGL